jgi:hypothetical protein
MSFLAPLLLLGFSALAIPVVLHLIERERADVIDFPSVMFLQRIPYPSVRRRRIRHWLLLLLRCAALALLVAAFARPFFTSAALATSTLGGAREVVILLDQSYSMGYGDRWDRATTAARQAVEALGAEDRATLVLFASGAVARPRSTTDRASLTAAIDTAEVTAGVTRYGPAIKLAQGVLEQSQLPNHEVMLVTDFQRSGWDGSEAVALPAGAVLTPIDVSESETSNVAIANASFERGQFSGRERVTTSARLINRGAVPIEDLEVALEIEGAELETTTVSLEPHGTATATFSPFTLTEPYTRGIIRTTPDRLPRDDVFNFVLSPDETVSVLLLQDSRPRADSALYLERALGIGTSPAFRTDVRRIDQLSPDDLAGRGLVILNDASLPGGTVRARLVEFVEAGGGLLVVLGERSSWPSEGADLLPGTFEAPTDRQGVRGGALGFVDYSHPVFELFSTPRSGDLSSARVFRYRPLTVTDGDAVIARFDDGAVALAERAVGRGRVLIWTSSLDNFWNDLALKPVYLPFVHRLSEYLARYTPSAPWFTAGQVLRLGRAAGPTDGADASLIVDDDVDRVALAPSGARINIPVGDAGGLLELPEQGFYEIRRQGLDEPRPRTVAVNLELEESNLAALDPQELAGAVAGRADVARPATPETTLSPEDRERRQAIWWYLLVAALLILAAETVVSNRLFALH